LSDDEIERILEAKDDAPPGTGSGDEYRVKAGSRSDQASGERPYSGGPGGQSQGIDEDRPDWGDEPSRPGGGNNHPFADEPMSPAMSAAGIAQGLMARGDKAGHAGHEEKRRGRPFGAGFDDDAGVDEGFTLKDKLLYFGRIGLPVLIGLVVGWIAFSAYLSWWQKGKLPELATVTGTVTLDGYPLAGAIVQFNPMFEETTTAPVAPTVASSSIGITDPMGRYTLMYIRDVPGAVPGMHRVQISNLTRRGLPLELPQYNQQTTLERIVKRGDNPNMDFQLTEATKRPGPTYGGFGTP
jgi:hypothetical protein